MTEDEMTVDDLREMLSGMTFRTKKGEVFFTVDHIFCDGAWLEMPDGYEWRVTHAHLLAMARSGTYDIREY